MPIADLDHRLAEALGWRTINDGWRWTLVPPSQPPSQGFTSYGNEELAWRMDGPHFSRDWAGLGLLVEAMRQPRDRSPAAGWCVDLIAWSADDAVTKAWTARFYRNHELPVYQASADSAPEAAALTAARALGLAVEE